MAFVPLFEATQLLGDLEALTLEDTSTGTDAAIVSRRVYIQQSDGTYLVPAGVLTSYVPWAWADSTIDIDVLNRDYGLSLVVQWLNVSNTVLYTSSSTDGFRGYGESFYYSLTENQAADPSILNDKDYWYNKLTLRVQIDDSINAIEIGGDIASAQQALDRAAFMEVNEINYF